MSPLLFYLSLTLCVQSSNGRGQHSETFTPPKPKPTTTTAAPTTTPPPPKWTGPANSCAKLVNIYNAEDFAKIEDYPKNVAVESATYSSFNDQTKKIIVRPGCMATTWMHTLNWKYGGINVLVDEMRDLRNVEYGEYDVKTSWAGTADAGDYKNSLTRVYCMCDPLKTEPDAKQEKNDCIEHHIFNENTQRCERDQSNVCGDIVSVENVTVELKIPNWPLNKRYDVNLHQAGLLSNHPMITSVNVRNGCFATLYSESYLASRFLEAKGYGEHTLRIINGYGHVVEMNTTRVVCECMNDDSNNEKFVVDTPKQPSCLDNHRFDDATNRCEWTGPEKACVEIINANTEHAFIGNIKHNREFDEISLSTMINGKNGSEYWNNKVVKAIVRNGCMANFWAMNEHGARSDQADVSEYTILKNVEYGEYEIEAVATGTAAGGVEDSGLSRISCYCDPTRTGAEVDIIRFTTCLANHEFDASTGFCEWTLEKNICGGIQNENGEKMQLVIPNWPLSKRYDVNLVHAKLNAFAKKVTSFFVRQHCFATLLKGTKIDSQWIERGKGYGNYTVDDIEVERVVCECMY